MKRHARTAAAALLLLTGATIGSAQERGVRFEGRIQWIAGQVATLGLDTGETVSVDLSRVPQDEYATLRTRDRIIVTGVISDEDNRVIGTSVTRIRPATWTPARQPAPPVTR